MFCVSTLLVCILFQNCPSQSLQVKKPTAPFLCYKAVCSVLRAFPSAAQHHSSLTLAGYIEEAHVSCGFVSMQPRHRCELGQRSYGAECMFSAFQASGPPTCFSPGCLATLLNEYFNLPGLPLFYPLFKCLECV